MTARPDAPTSVGWDVLRGLNRFRFLTAAQLNRLLWPGNTRDRNRHAQRQLHKLVQEQYALVIGELPIPNGPAAALVYTLSWRGRKALIAAGEPVPAYYRPSELADAATNPAFMPHTLAVVDVLIAAERFVQAAAQIHLEQLQLERDLRRCRLRVSVPAAGVRTQARTVTVVPGRPIHPVGCRPCAALLGGA